MNDRITDLLDEVADDDGRPLAFTAADVTARGRALRRRRTTLGAAAVVAAAAAAAVAVAALAPGGATPDAGPADPGPVATDPATVAPTYVPPTPGVGWTGRNTSMTSQDAEIMSQCTGLEPALQGWRFDAQLTDDEGTTATFVSDDHTQWRECTLGTTPGNERVSEAWPLDTSPVPDPWETPDGGVEFASLCPKDGPAGCSARLYTVVAPLRFGVADVAVRTPAGRQAAVAVGVATYVVRFVEDGDDTSTPPVVATLRDADGATVVRYDYNALMR